MPSAQTMLAFALASLVIVLIPGPTLLFVIGRSLSMGPRSGLLSAWGDALGQLPLITLVALGLGAVIAQSAVIFTTLKIVGAAYLAYIGVQAIRAARRTTAVDGNFPTAAESSLMSLRRGFTVGITNPKTIVFFAAVLPQFVDVRRGHPSLQMLVLGLIFTVIGVCVASAWALASGAANKWVQASPDRMRRVQKLSGGLMVGLGGLLLGAKS